MQLKPSSWPVEGDVETLPEVFLGLVGSQWPPARGDIPAGTAEVGSWSVTRQLTGSALPGQVRAVAGHSIAAGSVSFPQPDGAPLSPWGRGVLNLGPGGKCTLYASHAGPSLASGLRLGAFVVAPVAGSNTTNAVNLELDEDSIRLQKPFKLDWFYNASAPTFDASWVLDRIAAAGGYSQRDIEPTGSPLRGVFEVAGASAWDVAQQIAAATMGAVWITEAGVFTYRNRDSLRGSGTYRETIEALDSIESLEWTVDPSEVADRVEVTYTPTETVTSSNATTLWEATEPIKVGPDRTLTLNVDITGTTDRISTFIPLWPSSNPDATVYPAERMSRWAASLSHLGGGDKPSDTAIRVAAEIVSPSRVRLRITNTTNTELWLVDGNGNPCLILRTSLHIQPSEPITISSGTDEDTALSPLSIDAGPWVQDPEAAQGILEWVTSQTARPQAVVNQVRVKPDLGRQLGDVVRLLDGATGLRSKALISGVSLSGDHSGYTQNLDLALLAVVFADYDRWCIANGISTFADFDAWCIANNIITFAQFDNWLIDFGGTL
jgi:hypothetical protein